MSLDIHPSRSGDRVLFGSFTDETDPLSEAGKVGVARYSNLLGPIMRVFGFAMKIEEGGKVYYVNKNSLKT